MGQIKVTKTSIEGFYVIDSTVHGDSCGYFVETYNQDNIHEAELDMVFVQDNQSMSPKGVLVVCISRSSILRETGVCHPGNYV